MVQGARVIQGYLSDACSANLKLDGSTASAVLLTLAQVQGATQNSVRAFTNANVSDNEYDLLINTLHLISLNCVYICLCYPCVCICLLKLEPPFKIQASVNFVYAAHD